MNGERIGPGTPVYQVLALHWRHCQTPGAAGSMLGMYGSVGVAGSMMGMYGSVGVAGSMMGMYGSAGVAGSMWGMFGSVPVYCDWVRWQVLSETSC